MMKKSLTIKRLLYQVVQKSFQQFILAVTCSCSALATPATGQNGPDKKVSIRPMNVPLVSVLNSLEHSAENKYYYNSRALPLVKNVRLNASHESLSTVLQPLNTAYTQGSERSLLKNTEILTASAALRLDLPTVKYFIAEHVSGKVTSENGEGLVGVSIVVKGTQAGTVTDTEGEFDLDIPEGAKTIIFSFIGYLPTEVEIANQSVINVALKEDTRNLKDVIVVGYGITSKRKVNSAVSTLAMDKVASMPVQSINDAIAGRLQGVIVTTTTGAPGAKSQISIRGGGSPLYVIDNIIRSQADFENINPNDIANYSILKDAAATSIYGALGGNGVILVTTKAGRAGETNINYSYNTIFSQPTIRQQKLSSYDRLKAINEVYRAEGKQEPTPDDVLGFYKDQSKPFQYPNTDWQKIALKNWAPEQRHDLSISSGAKNLTYFGSLSKYHQGSILKTDANYNDRVTYRFNTVSDFEKINLKVTTNIDGYVETNSVPNSATAGSYSAIFSHIQNASVTSLAYNQLGLPSNLSAAGSPALELSPLAGYNKSVNRVFNGILGLDYAASFLDGLHLKFTGNYNMGNLKTKSWNATAPSYGDNSATPINGNPPSLTARSADGSQLLLQSFITYNKTFGSHSIDFTGGYEQAQVNSSSLSGTRQQYQILFDQFVAGPTVNQLASGAEAEQARASYLGRLAYSYDDKYYLEGTVRRDGNDLFPTGKQWGTFYAISGGWIATQEKFMQSMKEKHILDYLKIRGSYGVTGIVDGIGRFQYIPGYSVVANAWVVNGVALPGTAEPASLPSTNFSWYSIKSRNLGFDFALLDNRLSGTFDYFFMRTTGYVVSDPRFAATSGIGLPPVNSPTASLRREGEEFSLAWNDHIGKFTYKVGVNFTHFNQLWERNPSENETALKNPNTRLSGTDQASLQNGYLNAGYYANNSDLLNSARNISGINMVAGDLRYQDLNGDGKIDANDVTRIGKNTFPRINFGTTIDLGYKGVYLSAVIQGSGSRDRYLGDVIQGSSAQGYLVYGYQQDYWRPDNTNSQYPRQTSNAGVNGNNNVVSSDFWILKSQYLRLKYLQIGYDLKAGLVTTSKIKQLKIFVSGTNLLTSSNSLKYFIDPESDPNNYGFPIQRTVALGVNVGF